MINPFLIVLALVILFGLSGASELSNSGNSGFAKGCGALGAAILITMFVFAVAVAASHDKIFYNPW